LNLIPATVCTDKVTGVLIQALVGFPETGMGGAGAPISVTTTLVGALSQPPANALT
jgi:hypothetical protein